MSPMEIPRVPPKPKKHSTVDSVDTTKNESFPTSLSQLCSFLVEAASSLIRQIHKTVSYELQATQKHRYHGESWKNILPRGNNHVSQHCPCVREQSIPFQRTRRTPVALMRSSACVDVRPQTSQHSRPQSVPPLQPGLPFNQISVCNASLQRTLVRVEVTVSSFQISRVSLHVPKNTYTFWNLQVTNHIFFLEYLLHYRLEKHLATRNTEPTTRHHMT